MLFNCPNGPSWAPFTTDGLPLVSMSSAYGDIYGEEQTYSGSFHTHHWASKNKYSSTAQRNAAKPVRMRQPCLITLVVSFLYRATLKSTLRGKRCQAQLSTLHQCMKSPRRSKPLPSAIRISSFRPHQNRRFGLLPKGRLHHPTYVVTHRLGTHKYPKRLQSLHIANVFLV